MTAHTTALRVGALASVLLLAQGAAPTEAQPKPNQIEKLMREGWEVTGYVAAIENRTLILFKHKDQKYLVQCSILIDVTRVPRVLPVCYELR